MAKKYLAETYEQEALVEWAQLMEGKWPELRLMYHIPNEGKRSVASGAQLKRMGLRKGVPDICLPVARGGYYGLYIELKRRTGGSLRADQREWIEALRQQGYYADVCRGWDDAARAISEYMRGGTGDGAENI